MNSPLRSATAGAASASSGDMPVSRREPEPFERRVLPKVPDASLDEYIQRGGGAGLSAARAVTPDVVVGELIASGLRGRGGAGFPTGVKWRTMLENTSQELRTSVVVNAAEGEPGTFKDRAILEANPYAVLEGALIAAVVLDASSVVIAIKKSFENQIRRLRRAIAEISNAGWSSGVEVRIVEGPNEYLFGEETALLEVVDGRDPFPRIAPPYRRGSVEVVASDDDVDSGSGLAADVHMAAPGVDNVVPPTLVSNVETFANIAAIVARGAEWFRSIGTAESPGTIVSTVTGAVRHPGVGEVPMGTRLADLIELVGGGLIGDTRMRAVLVGVSGAVIGPNELDVAVSYEAMAAIGSGVGSAGFIVVSDEYSAIDVAAGVSRFLAIESCGQCTPCKVDGLRISAGLAKASVSGTVVSDTVKALLTTVADGARCSLATQHQTVIESLLALPMSMRHVASGNSDIRNLDGSARVGPFVIAEMVSIDPVELDIIFASKQPDWTYGPHDSGKTPVELATDHRA